MTKKYQINTQEFEIDGEKVTLGSYSYKTQKQITQLAKDGKELESIDLFLENTIKDWSLTDESGKKLEIKREVIDTLSGTFVNKLLETATKFNNITPKEVKN